MGFYTRYPWAFVADRPLVNSFRRSIIPGTSRHYARGYHGGIDAAGGQQGRKIRAGRKGIVIDTGNVWGDAYGYQVLLRHRYKGRTWYTFHAHLSEILVDEGQRVEADDYIGRVGSTGQSTGPHDHHELHTKPLWASGVKNPYRKLERARKRELRRGD